MPGLFTRARKHFGRRFGIAAPKMTVRTHVAWYWRWLGLAVLGAVTLAMAAWVYDAGRRFAGFDRGEVEQELIDLRSSNDKLQKDSAQLRAVANAADARLKIEQSSQTQLAVQMKQLVDENTRLKEDLAFFEGLNAGDRSAEKGGQGAAGQGLIIHRFMVERGAQAGQYRYRLLVVQGGRRDREFQGTVQILAQVQTAATGQGRDAMIPVTATGSTPGAPVRLKFRFFQRQEGSFELPSGATVRSIQIKVYENGSAEPRAVGNASLPNI